MSECRVDRESFSHPNQSLPNRPGNSDKTWIALNLYGVCRFGFRGFFLTTTRLPNGFVLIKSSFTFVDAVCAWIDSTSCVFVATSISRDPAVTPALVRLSSSRSVLPRLNSFCKCTAVPMLELRNSFSAPTVSPGMLDNSILTVEPACFTFMLCAMCHGGRGRMK